MNERNEFNQIVGYKVEQWISAKKPEKKVLRGKYCSLEPLEINKHAEALFNALAIDNAGESWTYLPYGPFKTLDEFKEWLKIKTAEQNTLLYAILDNTQKPIGISGYGINSEHGVIEVGHLHFSAPLKRTPLATDAMYLMMHYAFEELHYRRYEWKCNALNQSSRNAALRLGFTFEGIFRQHYVFKGRNRDTAWFSIIDSEWPAIKAKFERWLDPNNFDEQGQQKISLRN